MDTCLEKIERGVREGPFRDDWDSLGDFAAPAWFRSAKFGIFVHWGLYSVPAYANEWYSRNMYIEGTPEFKHHISTYGPQRAFGYKDFIPLFTAGKFDACEWAALFRKAGARYLVQVAEHHDGFQMYRSDISHYNAFEMGPKRDILGEVKEAVEAEGIRFAASSHRAEHWFFMGHGKDFDSDIREPLCRGDFYWPAMPEPAHDDLKSEPYPTSEFLGDWLIRTAELIDRYRPELLYFDWWIQHEAFKPYLQKLTAYYYNRGVQWKRPVAITYKHDAMMFGSAIVDIERGHFASAKPYVWQTDTSIARNSWCYTEDLDYKSAREILCVLIDTVSKNGNLLLNVGPKPDGSIAGREREILGEIGRWMEANGKAIYGSKVWRISEEGPTKETDGQFSESKKAYTREDFRFTVHGKSIYVFALRYPEDGRILIRALADSPDQNRPDFHGLIRDVRVLGFAEKPVWQKFQKGLAIETKTVKSEFPVVFEIEVL
jgi:alpha-L-fucosidase